MKGLPKEIMVKRAIDDNDKDSTWLEAHETLENLEDGETVGIYRLIETKKVQVARSLK